jgi:hypothetical protein
MALLLGIVASAVGTTILFIMDQAAQDEIYYERSLEIASNLKNAIEKMHTDGDRFLQGRMGIDQYAHSISTIDERIERIQNRTSTLVVTGTYRNSHEHLVNAIEYCILVIESENRAVNNILNAMSLGEIGRMDVLNAVRNPSSEVSDRVRDDINSARTAFSEIQRYLELAEGEIDAFALSVQTSR